MESVIVVLLDINRITPPSPKARDPVKFDNVIFILLEVMNNVPPL